MAIFDYERKNGIQKGTVGDECMECRRNRQFGEDYEPERLDYKDVYKLWINNIPHCLCMDCFKKTLGQYMLVDPEEIVEEEKPKGAQAAIKKATSKKKEKEDDKDGSETA